MQGPRKEKGVENEKAIHTAAWEKYELCTLEETGLRPSQMANFRDWPCFFPLKTSKND